MDNKGTVVFPTIHANDNWPTAFAKVQFIMNLIYKDQDILVIEEYADVPLESLLRNKHYFINEASLKEYVHHKYAWKGTIKEPYYSCPTEISHADSIETLEGRSSDVQLSNLSVAIDSDYELANVMTRIWKQQEINQLDTSTCTNIKSAFSTTADTLEDMSVEPQYLMSQDTPDLDIKRNLCIENDWTNCVNACHEEHHHSPIQNDSLDVESEELESSNYNESGDWPDRVSSSMDDSSNGKVNMSLHERLHMCLEDMHNGSSNPSIFHDVVDRVDEVLTLLQESLNDFKSRYIFISGPPGTGKTLIVRQCIEKCEQTCVGLKHCYLNGSAFSENQEYVYQRIASMIDHRSPYTTVQQLSRKLGTSTKEVQQLPYIIIFDEIDLLVHSGKKTHKGLQCIQTLAKWATDQSKRLILIGISNAVGDDVAKCITSLSKHCKHVVFCPYTAEDLESIILKRLGINQFLFKPGVIKFASQKIAGYSGDARQIIHTLHTVIKNVLQTMDECELLKPCPVSDTYQIINAMQVHRALNVTLNAGTSQMEEIISGLPTNAQILLALLCTIGEVLNNWIMIPVNDLMQYCFEAEREGVFFSFSSRHFWELFELLENAGLISPSDLGNFYHDDENFRFVKVGKNQYEISSILKDVTSQHRPFFDRMAHYVKANPICVKEMIDD